MARFASQVGLADNPFDYAQLWSWSVAHPEQFWSAVWRFGEVVASRQCSQVLVDGQQMPGARWFVGARLNFAENLLRYRDQRPAICAWDERGRQSQLSFAELYRSVAQLASALRQAGIRPGDRIAAVMPNIPEALVAMLATTSLGAIWSSCSPDFGSAAMIDRFAQTTPTLLFSVNGYRYKGKAIDIRPRIATLASNLPSLSHTVELPYLDLPSTAGSAVSQEARQWREFIDPAACEIEFEQLPFDHPVYILFSSGTTGVPKAIVHGAGGTLLQHLKEQSLHTDLTRDDRIFYFTTCGWMMWNWLASALALGSTLVLYEGAPFHPTALRLFDMVQAEQITVFGTSAKYIDALNKAGQRPVETHQLSALRCMLSTGSPLAPESYDFVYRQIKGDLQLSSISGGTDIVSCFALGNPTTPVWRGEIQTRGLGMAVEVFDDNGKPVFEQPGELVCTRPFPSLPIGFWNDDDGERYRRAYFERFPAVWTHGDIAEITERQGVVIYGRSDAVLNPGGVRIGTAEIYRQVEQVDEVLEALAVGQECHGDTRVILFVRLRPGVELDQGLRERIAQQIRNNTTPRHVPAETIAVSDIPRTRSGKLAELAVREMIHGRPVKNRNALANPESLELYRNILAG